MTPARPGRDASNVTQILNAIQRGDLKAADELLPIVYGELRRLAAQKLSQEKPGQTLQATALVHEAYIRLVGSQDPGWENRRHFFGAAAGFRLSEISETFIYLFLLLGVIILRRRIRECMSA